MGFQNRYKVLPLESWMIVDGDWVTWKDVQECAKGEIAPIMNRDGFYYDRATKMCWFEINGRAFLYEAKSFLYSLSLFAHSPLSEKDADALRVTISSAAKRNINLNDLNELLQMDHEWKMIRDTYRSNLAYSTKIMNEVLKKA